jgi:hypothetical protein
MSDDTDKMKENENDYGDRTAKTLVHKNNNNNSTVFMT